MHTITTMLQRPIVRVALAGIVLAAVAALGNRIACRVAGCCP
jgi:hypothetical protein